MINGKKSRKGKYSIKILINSKHDVSEHVKYLCWKYHKMERERLSF